MKTISKLITSTLLKLLILSSNVFFIWVVIEFILSLSKEEHEFKWISLILLISSIVVSFIVYMFHAYFEFKSTGNDFQQSMKLDRNENRVDGRSSFQKRLDDIVNERRKL